MTALLRGCHPNTRELFQGLAAALERLGGRNNRTDDAIAEALAADSPDFRRAARTIGVPVDDLVEVFQAEMLRRGYLIRPRWTQ